MLDKVKVNASKGNPNASSHEIAKLMLHSVWLQGGPLGLLGLSLLAADTTGDSGISGS
jgi:hypothetical protein